MKAPLIALKARNWGRRAVARLFPRHTRIAQQEALIAALNELVEETTIHADRMRDHLALLIRLGRATGLEGDFVASIELAEASINCYDEFIREA